MANSIRKIERLFKGDCSFSAISWLMDYFSNQEQSQELEVWQKQQWNAITSSSEIPSAKLKHVFYKLQYKLLLEKDQRQKKILLRFSQVAAILIIPLALFFLWKNDFSFKSVEQTGLVEMHCPEGIRTKFVLPDGSSGWLAGGSVLSYSADFKKERNVNVKGEAFFEVVHDPDKPFKVNLNDFNVKVLGTKFNVLNYKEDPVSEVVVVSGLVQVSGNEKKISEKLGANKKLQFLKEINELYLSDIDAKSYTSWIDGRLNFNNENLEDVCRKIKRVYNIDINLNMSGLEDQLFRADVQIGDLNELLKFMELTMPIKYELLNARELSDGNISKRKLKISKKDE